MTRFFRFASVALLLGLTGCSSLSSVLTPLSPPTQAQIQTAVADVQAACHVAETALVAAQAVAKGGALDTVNSVGAFITASCDTADSVATLAADPTSVAWLATLASTIKTATALAAPTT